MTLNKQYICFVQAYPWQQLTAPFLRKRKRANAESARFIYFWT